MNSKKTLVVAAICFPPCLIGPAILMGNLFRHFPKGSYHVLMGRLDHQWLPLDMESMLPAQYTFARYPGLNLRGNLFRRIRIFLRNIYALLEIIWKGVRIIRREKMDSIFVVSDHYVELAALIMHWLTGKKVVMWLPDLYYVPEVPYARWERILRRYLEPFLLRRMNTVLVTGEATQEYYQNKYGLETVVLPHSVDLNKYDGLSKQTYRDNNLTDIVFTGSVIDASLGGILDLVKVVNEFPDLNVRLRIFSNISPDRLQAMGVSGPRVACGQAKRTDVPALQKSADILFLPLSFEEHGYHAPSIVQTASPSKLPEYLAAGRPILVYAPPDSYYVRYAHQKGFGLVVDQPDPDMLRQAIYNLQHDETLRQRLVDNARRIARERHNEVKISIQLQEHLAITGYSEKRSVGEVFGLFRFIFNIFLRRLKMLKKNISERLHYLEMLKFYRQFIKKGDLCFDIGANMGNRTDIFLNLGAYVIAVEPQESCIQELHKKHRDRKNLTLVQKAIGEQNGEMELMISNAHTLSSLSKDWIDAVKKSGRFSTYKWDKSVIVDVTTLDELIARYGRPAFCKIDVEGYELQVLKGLSVPIKVISFEFTPEFINATTNCVRYLSTFGVVKFNYAIFESMRLCLHDWVDSDEISKILTSLPDRDRTLFGDVYAKFD